MLNLGKITGAIAGALVSHSAEGVYSGSNAGYLVVENNNLATMEIKSSIGTCFKVQTCKKKLTDSIIEIARWGGLVLTESDINVNTIEYYINYLDIIPDVTSLFIPSSIGAPVTITAVDILVKNGIDIADAENFLNSLTFEQQQLIRLALVDPLGNENFEDAVQKTYESYYNEYLNKNKSNTLNNKELISDIANNQIIEKDWRDYFLTHKNKIEEEWHEGAEETSEKSLLKHFKKHGKEMKSDSPEQYLNQAKEFSKQLRGSRVVRDIQGYTENVTRYYKNGKYIDIAPDGRIVSFGKQ